MRCVVAALFEDGLVYYTCCDVMYRFISSYAIRFINSFMWFTVVLIHHQLDLFVLKILIQFLLLKVQTLTRHVLQTITNVASIFINVMVPGHKTIELNMDDNIMLLKKDLTDRIFKQAFAFPPMPGFVSGLSLKIHNTAAGKDHTTPEKVLGIGVSNTK